MPRGERKAWARRPPVRWCSAARRFWCWMPSGPWCFCERAGLMIVLENLSKSFGAKTVLSGVSLEIPDGQNTVVIGPSGSGKSVTLKLIVGLLEPDQGRVVVDDATVHELDREQLAELRGRIGYVFQFAALFDSMTVAENIRLGLVRRGHGEPEIAARIQESLAVVD